MMQCAYDDTLVRLETPPMDGEDAGRWRALALEACRDALHAVETMRANSDPDGRACLGAIINCLRWALAEPASEEELSRTMRRTARVLRSLGG